MLGTLLMRDSLDHCVKCTICETFCPVSNVTPLFPGPKYAGPQAERFRVADEPSPDALARLLLGLRDLHAGLPAGRPHRRDQHAGARAARRSRPGFKLRDRMIARPTWAGRLGHAGRAARELDAAQQARSGCSARRRSASTATRRCRSSRAGRSRRWAQKHPTPAPPTQGRVLPRLRRELLRAAARRDDRRAARAQRDRGRGPEAGLLRAAAPVQRHVRRRARRTCTGWPSGSRHTRARASTSSGRRRAAR